MASGTNNPRRQDPSPQDPSRREFMKKSTAAALSGGALASLSVGVHAAGDDLLRVGLVGCGGRGTGAARQALSADKNVKLVAMGDAFSDRLEGSLSTLKRREEIAGKIDVPAERRFVGFDAYRKVIESGVDVVLLATPPHFRPIHLKAAVDAGKHVFAEKPVAVDAQGIRSVLQTCEEAKKKELCVVSGLCLRSSHPLRATMQRIHDGDIGDVHTLQANDYRGGIWVRPREDDQTDMQYQMRNWYYFTWLSGDFNVEQHVHYLDVCAWAMNNEYPVKAMGLGGRQVRVSEEHGVIYDHFSIVYEYANGTKLFSNCRQIPGCKSNLSASAVGSRGTADLSESKPSLTIK
ncbi:MAG: Gfo/Idh/MocA family oxidoreductase, partial [Planctomycetales bacterium]